MTLTTDDNFHRLDLYFDPFVHPYQKLSQPSMTDRLEMLSAREQLMEDIITIVEGYDSRDSLEYLSTALCDAVCKHFPLSPGPT